jgi:hypothetical protein
MNPKEQEKSAENLPEKEETDFEGRSTCFYEHKR